MVTVHRVVNAMTSSWQRYSNWQHNGIILTPAHQLIGTYHDLNTGRPSDGSYKGWQAHHVLEARELVRLGITDQFPAYPLQPCVLLPKEAHERINSVLQRSAPAGMILKPNDLVDAYADAYQLVGDYCGGGEHAIRDELIKIVRVELEMANAAK